MALFNVTLRGVRHEEAGESKSMSVLRDVEAETVQGAMEIAKVLWPSMNIGVVSLWSPGQEAEIRSRQDGPFRVYRAPDDFPAKRLGIEPNPDKPTKSSGPPPSPRPWWAKFVVFKDDCIYMKFKRIRAASNLSLKPKAFYGLDVREWDEFEFEYLKHKDLPPLTEVRKNPTN
jgi:hypothetical protein